MLRVCLRHGIPGHGCQVRSKDGSRGYGHQQIAKGVLAEATHCGICGGSLSIPGPHATGPYDPREADHVTSVAHGGQDEERNYQPAHRSCNRRKGGKTRRQAKG